MVIYYECHETVLRSITRWRHTLSASVLAGPEFWIIVCPILALVGCLEYEVIQFPDGLKEYDLAQLLGPVFSVAIFTVVFYNSQCYQRYLELYAGCMDVDTEVKSLVAELLASFGFDHSLRGHIVQCTKYIIASSFFLHISMTPRLKEEEWRLFIEKGLLRQKEVDAVRSFPGHTTLLLHYWAQRVASATMAKPATKGRYTAPERAAMTTRIYGHVNRLSSACRKVTNTLNLPIPFAYFHLLQILILLSVGCHGFLCCLLIGKVGGDTRAVGMLPIALLAFAMLALRHLAGELSNPFGENGVDFPSYDFMRHIQDHCVALLRVDTYHDPLEGIDSVEDFDIAQVARPCNPTVTESPEHRRQERENGGIGCTDAEDQTFVRKWRRPEDYDAGLKLTRWLEQEPKQRIRSNVFKSVRTSPWSSLHGFGSLGKLPPADKTSHAIKGISKDVLGPANCEINPL